MIVSTIIPYFKDPINIEDAIKSVLAQTYKELEIIIVDDENSINSKKILKNLERKYKNIKVISSLKRSGVSKARNLAIKKARGDLVAFLDSDDLWKKDKIKEQVVKLKDNKADICYTNYEAISENKKVLYKVKSPKRLYFNDLLKECPISCSSVILKRRILKNIKFKNLTTKEDYMLWLDLSKRGYKLIGVNKFLSFYRVRSKSLSSMHFNKIYSAYMIYSYYLKYNFLSSIFFVFRLYMNAFKKKFL